MKKMPREHEKINTYLYGFYINIYQDSISQNQNDVYPTWSQVCQDDSDVNLKTAQITTGSSMLNLKQIMNSH